jgi:hypothetical protein
MHLIVDRGEREHGHTVVPGIKESADKVPSHPHGDDGYDNVEDVTDKSGVPPKGAETEIPSAETLGYPHKGAKIRVATSAYQLAAATNHTARASVEQQDRQHRRRPHEAMLTELWDASIQTSPDRVLSMPQQLMLHLFSLALRLFSPPPLRADE